MADWREAPVVGKASWKDAPIVKPTSWKDAPLVQQEPEPTQAPEASMDNLPPRLSRWSAQIVSAANETTPQGVDSNRWGSAIAAVMDRETNGQNIPVHADGHGHGLMGLDDRYHDFARTEDVHDPEKNIKYGAAYLRDLYEKTPADLPFEDRLQRAAASYNAGPKHLDSDNPDVGTTGGNYGSDVLDRADQMQINIDKAANAPARSAEDAARDIELGRTYDTRGMSPEEVKTFTRFVVQREFAAKLAKLPRVAEFAAQSDSQASVMEKEVDNYGVIEELGKYAAGEVFNVGGTTEDGVTTGGTYHYTPPEWALAIGRAGSKFIDFAQMTLQKNWGIKIKVGSSPLGPEFYPARVEQPTAEDVTKASEEIKLPHDNKGVLGTVNNVAGMVPLMGAALANPAAAFGYMYLENTGRSYTSMRQAGFDHDKAAMGSELVGFSTAMIGAALGPMFKFAALPLPTRQLLGQVPDILSISISQSPTVRHLLGSYTAAFTSNMVMNAAQIAAESSIREAYDSSKAGRPYNASKVLSDAVGVYHNWAEMAALSIEPAYKAHEQRKLLYPIQEAVNADLSEQQKAALKIVNNWEERGRGIISLKDGFKLTTMVQQIQQSDFAKTNPQDARILLQHILTPGSAPRSVFIDAKYLEKLDPEALSGLGDPDLSVGETGEKVQVPLLDFLLHPQAEEMLKHVAPGEHLLTIGEAQKLDLNPESDVTQLSALGSPAATDPARQQEIKTMMEQHDAERAEMDDRRRKLPIAPPSDVVGTARRVKVQAQLDADLKEMTTRHEEEVKALSEEAALPKVSESRAAMDAWAWDSVSRLPSSDLEAHAKLHGEAAEARGREAAQAQEQATALAEAGQDNTDAKVKAQEATSRQKRSAALNKAATAAWDQAKEIHDVLQRLGADLPNEKTGKTVREVVWAAGQDFGQAYDAIMESMGLAKRRGYAAPDLVDVMTRLASEKKLTADQFDGWNLDLVDDLLKTVHTPGELSLNELREIRKAVSQVTLGADAENNLRGFGIDVAKNMISEHLATHFENLPNVSEGRRINATKEAALTNMDKVKARGAAVTEQMIQPHTVFFKLGETGDWLWFERYVPGMDRAERMWRERADKIKDIMEGLPEEIRASGQDRITYPDGHHGQRHEVWDAMLKVGAVGADRKIARGMGFGDDKGKNPVSAEDKLHNWIQTNLAADRAHVEPIMKMIEAHWKLFDGLWDEYERHFKERNLAPPEKLVNQEIHVDGKVYSGGYGGRLRWLDLNQRVLDHPGSLEALLRGQASGPTVDSRQTVERSEFSGGPDFSFNNVHDAMRKEIHDISMRPFVEDALKVFGDPNLRIQMAQKMGKEEVNAIYNPQGEDSFLHTVARGGVEHNEDPITRWVLKANGLAAYTAFAGNIRVMSGQLSHLLATMPALGITPDHMAIGVRAAFSSEGRANARARFDSVRMRYSDYEAKGREMNQELTGFQQWNNPISKGTDHLNWAAWREMDAFLSTAIAEAAYAKNTQGFFHGKGLDYDHAVREANRAVTEMMPPQDVYDQSPFVRNKSLAGFLFMVKNFPGTLYNVTAMNWWNAKLSGSTTQKALVPAQFVGMMLAVGALGEGLLMKGGAPDKDDPAQWWLEHTMGAMFYPTMLREPAMAMYSSAVKGDLREASNEMSRMTPAGVSLLASTIIDVGTAIHSNDEEKAYRAAAKVLGVGLRSPLPLKAYDVSNAIRNGEDPLDTFKKGMGYRQ